MGEFRPIPAGWFVMGSAAGQPDEAPEHRVWVDAFELAVDPVTRGEYACFREATGRAAPREWDNPCFADPDLPVVGVSWNDAVVYCLWRSSECGGRPVRLPTEAEWERAARGGRNDRAYPWGAGIPAWIPNGGKGPLDGPWPVALGPPNDYGIRGIAANVHEWCADWHGRDYYAHSPARNPTGPRQGRRRASRGGSWRHAVTISRVAARSKLDPAFRYTDYGFRVARDV
jgi:formylglycine-generating enzyme required for sulfatase activity